MYCEICEHLDEKKHRCTKHKERLARTKYTGWVKFTVYEKCRKCRDAEPTCIPDLLEG